MTPPGPAALGPVPGSRVAVVGGAGGIGRAVVAGIVACGAEAVVLDLPSVLGGAAGIPIDVADAASVEAAFAAAGRAGPLHGLVNLAGFAPARQKVAELDPAAWAAVIAVNLTGAFLLARAAMPLLRAAATPEAPAAVVNVASGLAARLLPGYGAYGASKAGLIALTKALAAEEAPRVRANAVAPGAVETAFLDGGAGRAPHGARLDVPAYVRNVPLGRIAHPEDVAAPILFLLSPGAAYMTGQVLWINGGGLTP